MRQLDHRSDGTEPRQMTISPEIDRVVDTADARLAMEKTNPDERIAPNETLIEPRRMLTKKQKEWLLNRVFGFLHSIPTLAPHLLPATWADAICTWWPFVGPLIACLERRFRRRLLPAPTEDG